MIKKRCSSCSLPAVPYLRRTAETPSDFRPSCPTRWRDKGYWLFFYDWDSFFFQLPHEGADDGKAFLQGFSIMAVADAEGSSFLKAGARDSECAGLLKHSLTENVGVDVKVIVDKRHRAGSRPDVGSARLLLDPCIEDGKVFAEDSAVPFKDFFLMAERKGCRFLIEKSAADKVIVLLRERISSLWLRARAAIVSSIMPQLIRS